MKNELVPGDCVRYTCGYPTYMWSEYAETGGPRSSEGRQDVLPGSLALVLAVKVNVAVNVHRLFVITDAGCIGWSYDDWFERVER